MSRLLVLALTVFCVQVHSVYAQGSGSTSLSGVVTDTGGGVIPGATVVVKNDATGVTYETVSSSTGAFSVPALDAGTYTVTVSLCRLQDGRRQRRPHPDGDARGDQGEARSRRADRDRRSRGAARRSCRRSPRR